MQNFNEDRPQLAVCRAILLIRNCAHRSVLGPTRHGVAVGTGDMLADSFGQPNRKFCIRGHD
jgi:hypothetical protein